MRKIHEYQVVRYFPNELSDEFINVGINCIMKRSSIKEFSLFKIVIRLQNRSIKIHQSNRFDFEIESIKKRKIYHSNIGSIANKHDIFKMTWETPLAKKENEKYHFLNIATIIKENEAKERFALNKINVYEYTNDKEIHKYMEKIAI